MNTMAELKRILHVEDDRSIQAVAKLALETLGGFEVLSCINGQEALDKVVAFNPDFVLLDVMMPGMDGPAVLVKLRELIDIKQIPVAFMTAKVQPQEVEHYRLLGALDVIVKPFDAMKLAGQVRAIWSSVHG